MGEPSENIKSEEYSKFLKPGLNAKLEDGIVCCSESSFYWNQIPRDIMGVLVADAQQDGWKLALEKHFLPIAGEYAYRYTTNEARGDWHFIAPVDSSAEVLDLGCGWGASTTALARNYKHVCAVDSTKETLRFLKIRAQQENLNNLSYFQIDPLDKAELPFADASFDLVVLNGVLEWIGAHDVKANPQDVQVRALKEIRRVLKPGGSIYVGIENRYAATYFVGSKDHSGLPFTSLLPRSLANVVTKFFKNAPYRTYTYTYQGYKSLLQKAGLRVETAYYPLPTYREPYSLAAIDKPKDLELALKFLRAGLKKKVIEILIALGLERVFMHSFSIFAKAEPASVGGAKAIPSILSSRAKWLKSELGAENLRVLKIRSRRKADHAVAFLVFDSAASEPVAFLKSPRDPSKPQIVIDEHKALEEVAKRLEGEAYLADAIVPVKSYCEKTSSLLFEVVKGTKVSSELSMWSVVKRIDEIVTWLIRFQRYTQKDLVSGAELVENHLRPLVNKWKKTHGRTTIGNSTVSEMEVIMDRIAQDDSFSVPVCASHGDFNPFNIFKTEDGIKIVDWAGYRPSALCVWDFFHLLSISDQTVKMTLLRAENDLVRHYASEMGMTSHQVIDLRLFYKIYFELYHGS